MLNKIGLLLIFIALYIISNQRSVNSSPQFGAFEIIKTLQTPSPYNINEEAEFRGEDKLSQVILKYDNTQQGYANFIQPRPIVDTLREQDKYGNQGDKGAAVGSALVNGFEKFSNFLNSIVDLPVNLTYAASRGLTTKLNSLGAKLVGLE